jgi:tetratricopeptide (TPR) repeat protein
MGVVYEARQVTLNRKVALKVLSGGLGLTPKAVLRFRREAEAAAKLHHTNIVPIYATGEDGGTHFYAMELIDGPSLDHVISQMREQIAPAPLSPELAETGPYVPPSGSTPALSASSFSSDSHYFDNVARMVAEVADALDYAHKNGVIHRDIKPSNLLLSPAGRLSLNDFGLARVLEQPGLTISGEFVGTPAYMSPEQIAAGRIPLDHRTDIYSLGATLYELLTLEPPHKGQSREQLLSQIVHKEPKAPRSIQKKVPVDLETICLKCLEKDPDRRYQSAGKLAEDLRRYVNRFAISARRVGPVGRLVKWVRRRPALAAAMACSLVLALVTAFFGYQGWESRKQLQMERRQHALDDALTAAMGGDLEKAEMAISEAETHGATPAQVIMLRGQVAFGRGDWERARADLEQAVKLDPDSVAARGMLAMAYLGFGDIQRYGQTTTELDALTPRTAEDYLFKGYAQRWSGSSTDPFGLQDLNEAVKRSRSPLARAIRADNRMLLAESRTNLEQAERAVADVQFAKEYLADNPYVLSVSVWVHVVAANLYLEAGNPEKQKEALEEAKRDAGALKRWDTLTFPFESLWVYFEQTGQEPACFDLARRAAEKSDAPIFADKYAQALFRRGQSREALEVLKRRKWNTFLGDYFRVCILAELHPDDRSFARAAYEDMAKRHDQVSGFPLYMLGLKRLLGYKDEAVVTCRALVQQGSGPSWLKASLKTNLDYWTESISENEYLQRVDNKWARLGAHYQVAIMRLNKGDKAGAREHLRRAVETRVILNYDHDFTRSFLARMEKDPTWPPWLPIKKEEPKP